MEFAKPFGIPCGVADQQLKFFGIKRTNLIKVFPVLFASCCISIKMV
jgi:hypothetical protein